MELGSSDKISRFEEHCPKTFRAIAKTLALENRGESTEKLIYFYQELWQSDAFDEFPIVREKGVSFNPRQGRICDLLLNEGKYSSVRPLLLALLSSARIEKISGKTIEEYILDVQKIIHICTQYCNLPMDPTLRDLVLAHWIDLVRHLHMTAIEKNSRIEIFAKIRASLNLDFSLIPKNRLAKILDHSLNSYLKRNQS
ncbi:MAG: hypothetical protein SGJ02_13435 [bacterium]|nr:hypothetical protein [bacterium]